jgi:DNA-binding MarR family transcriptional regulator
MKQKIHPKLLSHVGYCLHKVALRFRSAADEELKAYGLVGPQFGILKLLTMLGDLTQIELGSHMIMDKATMVRMIDGLEEKGYLLRTNSTRDRRAKILRLTPAGKKMMVKLDKIRQKVEDEFLKPLSATERAQLKKIVTKLLT